MNLSYAFTPYDINGKTVIRPMLPVTLKGNSTEFPTALLVDSGADFSMIRREIVEDAFGIDISKLKGTSKSQGIAGETIEVAFVTLTMVFGYGRLYFREDIPFQVPLNPDKNPPLSLIGRDPFFYRYRVDFRMGYTDDSSLGKFVIYPEKHRSAEKYSKPMKIKSNKLEK